MSFRTLQVQLRDKQALSPITGSQLLKTSGDIKKSYFVKTARSRFTYFRRDLYSKAAVPNCYKRSVPKILISEKYKQANLVHATLTAIFVKSDRRKAVFAKYFFATPAWI
jgi:hypothetical protein